MDRPHHEVPLRTSVNSCYFLQGHRCHLLVVPWPVDPCFLPIMSTGGGGDASSEPRHQVIFKGKLIVVGDTNVGKTSIVERLTENRFSLNQKTSVAVAYSTKQVIVDDRTTVKFDIWDTAGQERFRSISALFYRGSAAAIIVYDITDRKSFDTARNYWLTQLKTHAVKDCIIVFAGKLGDFFPSSSSH